MAKVMYLPLAEKMLDKFVKENRMTTLAELRLYHGVAVGQQTRMSTTSLLGMHVHIIQLFNKDFTIILS